MPSCPEQHCKRLSECPFSSFRHVKLCMWALNQPLLASTQKSQTEWIIVIIIIIQTAMPPLTVRIEKQRRPNERDEGLSVSISVP